MVAAALRIVAWAKATFTVRGHFLVSNTLCQGRPTQFWSSLDLAQPYFMTDCGQARRCRCAHGQQIPVEADVHTHEFVEAVGNSVGFPVCRRRPTSNLVAASPYSFVVLRGPRCRCVRLRALAQAPSSLVSLNTSQTHLVANLR